MKDVWRKNWLRSIREISALDWQKSLWGKSDNPHHSYVEYIESYVDDLALTDGYSLPVLQSFLSEAEVEAAANFHRAISLYHEPGSPYDHVAILSDPAWVNVTRTADETRHKLLSLLSDHEELEILKQTEPKHP